MTKTEEQNLEDLLENSDDGGVVIQGTEQSFDFNPPDAMSSQAAATGFDSEFTETVVMEEESKEPPARQ